MRSEIITLQRKLGVTAVYVTHDQTEAMTMGDKIAVLKDGVIQQVSTPAEMYSSPQSIFVASFIGSPQINLFHGKIERNTDIQFKEHNSMCSFVLAKENFLYGIPPNGTEITIGIRPEAISISNLHGVNAQSIEAEVKSIEFVGHESLVYFETSDTIKCCRVPSIATVTIGNRSLFYVDTTQFLIFGSDGLRL